MDLSEILLYLDLMKKEKKRPELHELEIMIYFLKNYEEVKIFQNKINEHKINLQFVFYNRTLIHFIEEYENFVELKNMILHLTKGKRKYPMLFKHQILLSKTKEQANKVIKEARNYGVELGKEWNNRYDSMWNVKEKQIERKAEIEKEQSKSFLQMYENFCEMKLKYFNSLSLNLLKKKLLEQPLKVSDTKSNQVLGYYRSVYVREFARKVSNGICQLCDKAAPFTDKRGNPFLEVHHVKYLSQEGTDTIDNVVALCPNCHRKIHQLELEEDLKKIEEKASANINM